mgnify:CR=1 FL=1
MLTGSFPTLAGRGASARVDGRRVYIGKLSAEGDEFYSALDQVMSECHRVMKPGKALGWLIGDQGVKKKFTPVGFQVYERLAKHFEPVDIISLARRGQTSNTSIWHSRALRFNFYLRGFKYLFIMRKSEVFLFQEDQVRSEYYASGMSSPAISI